MNFGEDFSYFKSAGTIIAAHRGIAHHLSPCKLAIVGDNWQTWYSHINIAVGNFQQVEQGDIIAFIEMQRLVANCECDPVGVGPNLGDCTKKFDIHQ